MSEIHQQNILNSVQKSQSVINKTTGAFFNRLGGKIQECKWQMLPTYGSANQIVSCANFYIVFNNQNLFGDGDFGTEIYPRYRQIRTDWYKALKQEGVDLFKQAVVGFVPLLKKRPTTIYNDPYLKSNGTPLGIEIENIHDTESDYFKKISKKFDLNYALKERGGAYVGPEGGMLVMLEKICMQYSRIDCFVDIGAGTGELSAFVVKNFPVKKIIVNELSNHLSEHLNNYLGKLATINYVRYRLFANDCKKMSFPEKTDIISVGVFYGDQPSFIKEKGGQISKSLGRQGILLIQSAMPEAIFTHLLIVGKNEEFKNWPWYSISYNLYQYFNYIATFFIENEFITIASNSKEKIQALRMLFRNSPQWTSGWFDC